MARQEAQWQPLHARTGEDAPPDRRPTRGAAESGQGAIPSASSSITHEHYRQLFLNAQQARQSIRSGIGTPVAATAFTVFNLGTLVQHFDANRWQEPIALAIAVLATASVAAVLAAAWNVVMVEWHFVHVEPPDLNELLRIQHRAQESGKDEQAAADELCRTLTGGYYAGYVTLLLGNARSANFRTRSLRLVLLALACVALSFLLLPLHLAGSTSS